MDTLFNWVWQASAIAIGTTLVLGMARRASASARYRVWCGALAVIMCLPLGPELLRSAAPPATSLLTGDATYIAELPESHLMSAWVAVLSLYLGWVAVTSIRLIYDVLALRRARTECRTIPPAVERELAHWIAVRHSGRRARLVVCDRAGSAAVLGVSSPLIAIAPTLLTRLTHAELDRVVIHEWAHVQRRDDIANLVQLVIRVFAGCHPAVWWALRQLRLEREAACDEMAVRLTGSPKAYAACLARLAELRAGPSPVPTPGVLSGSHVRRRVIRVLRCTGSRSIGRDRLVAAIATGLVLVAAAAVSGMRVGVRPGSDGGQPGVRPGSDGGQTGVRPGSNGGQTAVRSDPTGMGMGSDPGRTDTRGSDPTPQDTRRPGRRRVGDRSAPVRRSQSNVPALPSTAGADRLRLPESVSLSEPPSTTPEDSRSPVPAAENPATAIGGITLPDSPVAGPLKEASAQRPEPATPWGAATDAGLAIGRGSQKAAVKTAGFFNRLGKQMAGAF